MSKCLIALGSNLGDRQATLEAALEEIDNLSLTQVIKKSRWHETQPIGGPTGQPAFLNGAALVESALDPRALSVGLHRVEAQAGRKRRERWAARSLDIDLLLVDEKILSTPDLEVPHPRMSFRRFVLEPAAEIAPDFMHPVLGSTLGQLLEQLNSGANVCAVLALRDSCRAWLADQIVGFVSGAASAEIGPSPAEAIWPNELTRFVRMGGNKHLEAGDSQSKPNFPKLSVVLESDRRIVSETGAEVEAVSEELQELFSTAIDEKGRGPTLTLRDVDRPTIETELKAALASVWPDLCSGGTPGVK